MSVYICVCVCVICCCCDFFDGIFLVVVSLKPMPNSCTYVVSLSDHDESKNHALFSASWSLGIRHALILWIYGFYVGKKFLCTLWARITKNTDWSTGPLARPFPCSRAPLTRLLTPHYSLCSRAPLRSLAHFAHSRARGTVIDRMAIHSVFLY